MIIAFDTFFLSKRFRNVGVYEYTKNLFNEFHKLAREDSSISFRYFVSSGYSDEMLGLKSSPGFEAVSTRLLGFHRLWRLGLVNCAAVHARTDLLFSSSPNIFPLGVLPVAVTIHDAIPTRLPAQLVGASRRLRMNAWVAAKRSQKILTDSEHSKKDLIELYDLPAEKVSVVYLGYDQGRFNSSQADPSQQAALQAKLRIQSPYILHHGMVELRKNVTKLIEAYELLVNRRANLEFQLVLAGKLGFGSDQILRAAEGLASRGKVIFTGPLIEQELAPLVKGASLCVIPSLYEGFCLPMVEAMACGVPTIAANSSCLPEVSGGLLRYFDPLSVEDMAATINDVLEHRDLQTKLVENGLKRASEFSWQRCARETIKVLTGLGGGGKLATT